MPNSSPKQTGFVAITIILVVVLALAVGGALFYFSQKKVSDSNTLPQTTNPASTPKEVPKEAGPSATIKPVVLDSSSYQLKTDILNSVDEKIATLSAQANSNSPKEVYLYFGVNGSTTATDWVNLGGADIKFNTSSYPGASAFYFVADLQTDAPDRTGFARLYDLTHSAGVAGSDINYRGLDPSFKQSGAMSFGSGDIQLRVQIHSELNNTLIYNPRIKIVY